MADVGGACLLLESLSIGLFAFLLVRQQTRELDQRVLRRMSYEAESLAAQSGEALLQGRPGWVGLSVKLMGEGPTAAQAKVTDTSGNMLFISKGESDDAVLVPAERAQIPLVNVAMLPSALPLAGTASSVSTPSTPGMNSAAWPG